jgi:hypothetical protein
MRLTWIKGSPGNATCLRQCRDPPFSQPEYNKAGDEVWFSVWNSKDQK